MAAAGMREGLLVVVERDDAPSAHRVEAGGVEAVAAAEIEKMRNGPDRQRPQDAALEKARPAEGGPLPVHIDLVVEPLGGGAEKALDLVLQAVRGGRRCPQACVQGSHRWYEH